MSAGAVISYEREEPPSGKIFISYTHKDYEFVQRLTSDLERVDGVMPALEVFFDKRIRAGESWADSLIDAIESADYILLILSPDYLASQWAQKELEVALLHQSERNASIIPLLIRPCMPTGLISRFQFIDFTESYDAGFNRLLSSLGLLLGSQVPTDAMTTEDWNPQELRTLLKDLKEAVDSFRSRPTASQVQQSPSDKLGQCCFIIMPFGDEALNVVYEDFVKPIVGNECGLLCERGDDVFGSNVIMEDILTSIKRADLIIADLTRKNANVFYEVGISHVLGKEVLLMSQSIDDVPFDLRHRRVLLYEYSPRGCKRLEKALKDNIFAIIQKLENTNDRKGASSLIEDT